jgi:hypothetical protein
MARSIKFTEPGISKFFDKSTESCFSLSTTAAEKRKTFRIDKRSNATITKIKVDGCLIKTSQNKCDFVFVIESTQDVIFVELKSEDVGHAYEQIVKTIEYFKGFVDLDKEQIEGCIVSSSLPRLANLKFQNLILKFKKEHGKSLSRYTNQCIKQV